MVRSSSAEPPKSSKRKGTRSVSTLTPSQLARKRANDREAQRAIRARTKEHIERLEQEVEELRRLQSRDKAVQDLLRRNKTLEDELIRLKESMGVSITSSPYSAPVFDDNLSTGSGAIPSPRTSPFPSGDYNSLPDISQTYVPLPNSCESWASAVPNPVPSNVSSPSSSGNTDDYGTGYIPTSMPSSILPSNGSTSTNGSHSNLPKDVKLETYDDVDSDAGFRINTSMHSMPTSFMAQQPSPPQQHHHSHQAPSWTMYHPMYYPQVQSPVH